MKTEQILMCMVALILGMLLANMLKSVCGCKVVEGQCQTDDGSPSDFTACNNKCGAGETGICIFGTCLCSATTANSR